MRLTERMLHDFKVGEAVKMTRFEGTIKSWNDERGFGFIEPAHGSDEIFVHVKAFSKRVSRPQVNQRVSFEVETGPQGKKRAHNVALIVDMRSRSLRQRNSPVNSPAKWGTATLFTIPAFLIVYLAVSILWRPPLWVAALYGALSAVSFIAYALDKSAAVGNRRRIPENTLHLIALAGGWPGALVAQQLLRHKSTKVEFRSAFWMTVIVNVGGFIFFSSPAGRNLIAAQ
jgi:uncharacterized membrane protein YsdA (DUF1294 family)/cold shock CspA family protein